MCAPVCECVCRRYISVYVCVCVCVRAHACAYFNHNVVNVVNVVMFYLIIISDAKDEFVPGDKKDLLT